ncbi:hypothetical protein [Rothia nasimurium]|uniref:hypothetical protein n=1 Tax=Rothia nasimurium TaxID=85336 RepID=UPI001F2B81A6|nr:hypothetical protein [Rothia nasimurium]
MENKKAEEEVSALITGVMLLGSLVPAAIVWVALRFTDLSNYLLDLGVLERSERVVVEISGGVGLDLGRLLIWIGFVLLVLVLIINLSAKVRREKYR